MIKNIVRSILTLGLVFSMNSVRAFATTIAPFPGTDPSYPLVSLPQPDGSYRFAYEVSPGEYLYIDPDYATGYDYQVLSGPNFASVRLPSVIGDDGFYNLWLWNSGSSSWEDAYQMIAAEVPYTFSPGGVDRFRITGIDISANLLPDDPDAFVTGVSFVSGGAIDITQTPIVTSVPEPSALLLMSCGLAALVGGRIRKNR
jgi:hypothetical protein